MCFCCCCFCSFLDHFQSFFCLPLYQTPSGSFPTGHASLCLFIGHILLKSLSPTPTDTVLIKVTCNLHSVPSGVTSSPHLILTAICHMGPWPMWDNFSRGSQDTLPCSFPPVWLLLLLALNSKWCLRPWPWDCPYHPIPHLQMPWLAWKVLVAQSCLTCNPMDCTRLLCSWDTTGYNTGAGQIPSRDLPDLAIKPTSPALAGGFVTNDPPGTSSLCFPSKSQITRRQGAAPTCLKGSVWATAAGNNGSALSATHYLEGFKRMIIFLSSFFWNSKNTLLQPDKHIKRFFKMRNPNNLDWPNKENKDFKNSFFFLSTQVQFLKGEKRKFGRFFRY